jgi:hypothetical protein
MYFTNSIKNIKRGNGIQNILRTYNVTWASQVVQKFLKKRIGFPISSFQMINCTEQRYTQVYFFFELCYLSCHTVYYFLNW